MGKGCYNCINSDRPFYEWPCTACTVIHDNPPSHRRSEDKHTVETVELPCKIGDFVWAIRNFKGKKHPQRGIVSDMYFLKDMSLQIVVKYVARGKWGETIFATDKEAYAAIEERKSR